MAYAAGECPILLEHGFDDILLAYPTVQESDLAHIVAANRAGATARVVIDCVEHVEVIARAARDADVRIPVIIDVDVSYRPGGPVHLGVRRSPVHAVGAVVALADHVAARPELRFDGIMAYEAQIAGLSDADLGSRVLKTLSRPRVLEMRAALVEALGARGLGPLIVNGGGTGSLDANAREPALTEIAAGSGFLASHLFDRYRGPLPSPGRLLRASSRSKAGRGHRDVPWRRLDRVGRARPRPPPDPRLPRRAGAPRSRGGGRGSDPASRSEDGSSSQSAIPSSSVTPRPASSPKST